MKEEKGKVFIGERRYKGETGRKASYQIRSTTFTGEERESDQRRKRGK